MRRDSVAQAQLQHCGQTRLGQPQDGLGLLRGGVEGREARRSQVPSPGCRPGSDARTMAAAPPALNEC